MAIQLSEHFTYKKLLRFTLPSIVMMIFTSIYGVIDGLFVSNFVGKTPFAAINLIMPFIMILGGFGFMIGTGGSALVAKTLGEKKHTLANRYFTMLIYLTLIVGFILSALGLFFIRPISLMLGATEAMLADCVMYGRIMLAFSTAYMLQSVFQSFLITAEKPRLGLAITVAAGITNMVLDALFIVGFHWGVAGAAAATVISQCIGGLLPVIYFLRAKNCPLKFTRTRLEAGALIKTCANGSSELMSNISTSLVSILYNFQLIHLSGEDGVAAYGVLMYVQFVFIAIFIGYSISSGPIISYHFGAGNHGELKNMLRKSLVFSALGGLLLMLAAQLLASPIAHIFVGYDAELFAMTKHAFSLFSYSFLFAGLNLFASAFFTALNSGGVSAAISFLRALVFQTVSVLVLPLFLGIDGIWLALTAAELLALFVSAAFLLAKRRKYHY